MKMNYFNYHDDVISERIYGRKVKCDVDLTIVIPTYKRSEYLRKTIESILNQKPPAILSYQVVIVSNDPSFNPEFLKLEMPESIFSIYRNTKNIGMAGNMNRCACLASGKYIAYLHDDDILLDTYLITIEDLMLSGTLDNVDCLIPNRYNYFDVNNKSGIYGQQAFFRTKVKNILKRFLSVGVKKRLLQRVTLEDCAETWFNCFGGPTCGTLFKKQSLMNSHGFPEEYKYVFDFVFFIKFSVEHTVMLYDKYLSVYRMTESASNRPEVQADFYKGEMLLLEEALKQNNLFVHKYQDEIKYFSKSNKSKEAQELIIEKVKIKRIKYMLFRIRRFVALMRKNVYKIEVLPQNFNGLL